MAATGNVVRRDRVDALAPVEGLPSVPGARRNLLGARPDMRWVALADMRINRAYQRDLSQQSLRMIRAIAADWNWRQVKALSVVAKGKLFEVVDGQHTAIAAASRGDILVLPCLVSKDTDLGATASDFVALNSNRITLTPTQVFQARIVAGDPEAVRICDAVEAGGGRILRNPTPSSFCQPGDTVALSTLRRMAAEDITRVIALGVRCKLAPVPASFIKGVGVLMRGGPWRMEERAIVAVVRSAGMRKLQQRAIVLRDKFPLTSGEAMAKAIRAEADKERVAA